MAPEKAVHHESPARLSRISEYLRGDLLDAVRKIQSYGMEVMGGFIISDEGPRPRSHHLIRDIAALA